MGPLLKAGLPVAVLAGALSNPTPPFRRCYRTRRELSSLLRFSAVRHGQGAGGLRQDKRGGQLSDCPKFSVSYL
jgi:hypothetical protein